MFLTKDEDVKDRFNIYNYLKKDNYLETGVLPKNQRVKLQVKMLNNGKFDDWSKTMFSFASKQTSRKNLAKLCLTLQNTLSKDEVFGIIESDTKPFNLGITKQPGQKQKISDTLIDISFDQKNQILEFVQEGKLKYQTKKIEIGEDYRIIIMLGTVGA